MGKKVTGSIVDRLRGMTRCAYCRDPIVKDSAWPIRGGFVCRTCKWTCQTIEAEAKKV